jgi:hypothetical protein
VPLQFVLSTTGCAANIHYPINFLTCPEHTRVLSIPVFLHFRFTY